MTATVGGLLDRLHTLAAGLASEPASTEGEMSHEGGWRLLAARTATALGALPFHPDGAGARARDLAVPLLADLAAGDPNPPVVTVSGLVRAAELVGAIVDVLVDHRRPIRIGTINPGGQTAVEPVYVARLVDEEAAAGLQSSMLAGVWALARWSLSHPANPPDWPMRKPLQLVLARTEPHALLPVEYRRSALEHLSATSVGEASLLGAVHRWAGHSDHALSQRLVSTGTVAMMASDLSVLAAALAVTARTQVDTPARTALLEAVAGAHAGWKQAATWPGEVLVAGPRAEEYLTSSRQLRALVKATLHGPDGWRPAGLLKQQYPQPVLDTVSYTLAAAARRVGDGLSLALHDLMLRQGGVWRRTTTHLEGPVLTDDWVHADQTALTVGDTRVRWRAAPLPVADVDVLVQAAGAAARSGRAAERHLHQLLNTPSVGLPETVPALTVHQSRVQAIPTLARTPTPGVPHHR